jgi:predicted Kef-type K+ transport protein
MALGAFLAGMIVGQSEFSARSASDALPMRDAFAVLFLSRWECSLILRRSARVGR